MAQAKIKRNLTEGPLLTQIILFTLPLIATAVLQLLFNTADVMVVGRWGGATEAERDTALAAVGSCGALTNLIVNLFFGLSVGAGVSVAHGIGAKQDRDVRETVHTSVLASLVCGVVVTVFGIVMARPLLVMMQTDPLVLDQAVPYMCAYFCGMPANMLYNYCASMLRSSGDTTRPLIFLSVAGVANVALNLVMVIVFGLGAVGVGIATAVSHWISCILIVAYMMRYRGPCRIELRELRIHRDKLVKIITIGIPAGLQGTLFSISNVLIQSSINGFGEITFVAGNTAASNIDGYIYATQNALYHTALTFVGQNLGARNFDRLKRSIFACAGVVTGVGISIGAVALLFGRPLLSIFTDSTAVIDAGMIRLTVMATTYFLCGLMEVGCGVMRGLGKSIPPMLVSLIGSCLFRIVWIFTVFAAFPTPIVLYISYPISWVLTALAHFIFCHRTYRAICQETVG